MTRRLDPERADRTPWEPWEIAALHRAGSLPAAQDRLDHRPPDAVRARARRERVAWATDPRPWRPWTPEDDALIVALREDGVPWALVGERIGRTEGAARFRGVTLRRRATLAAQYPPATVTAAAR